MYIRLHSGIGWPHFIDMKSGHVKSPHLFWDLSSPSLGSDRQSAMHSHKPLLTMGQTVMSVVRCHSIILHCVIPC